MNNKEVLEIKRRFKKNECTFTRMCGCYVNGEKNILLNLEETFLNLEEDEFYKYLEIAKKTLSGTIGNNLLELEFPIEEESAGGRQQFLMALKQSKLKEPELLETFYHLIINSYDYAGNYLILVFHDAYDVMTKTSDNNKLDESEEVFEYLLCAICPVTLSKPALGYLETENRIGPRIRDWVVNPPDTGFLFPTFTDRSSDIHATMYYTKDAKEPHKEFVENVLGCVPRFTATEQKNTFQNILNQAISDEETRERTMAEIQETISQMMDDHAVFYDSKEEPLILTKESIQEVLTASGVDEEIAEKIEASYAEKFQDEAPIAGHLVDSKLLAAHAQKKEVHDLEEQVILLQEKLEEITSGSGYTLEDSYMTSSLPAAMDSEEVELTEEVDERQESIEEQTTELNDSEELEEERTRYDVILQVKPQKMDQISYQILDGKKCIVIPMEEDEHANVNGHTDLV